MVEIAIWKTCGMCGSKKAVPADIEDLKDLENADTAESYLAAIKAAYGESFPTGGPKMVAVWTADNGEIRGAVIEHICEGKCRDRAKKAFDMLFSGHGKPVKKPRKPRDPNAPKRGRKPKSEQTETAVETAEAGA